jgi:ABC-type antimicrobial peptide transport system permease subunit
MIGAALAGIAVGLALSFILCVATSVIAVWTGSRATLPGLFTAAAGTENEAMALEFQPNFVGIAVLIAVSVLVRVVMAVRSNHASPGPTGRN